MSEPTVVAVYADESCLGNGREGANPGAAAGMIEMRHPRTGRVVRRDFWVAERATTNNRMALRSALTALGILSAKGQRLRVVFTSDSRYLVDGMTRWVGDWMRRGWTRRSGPIENLELWKALVAAARVHDVEWRWVRGHAGHPQNEYANVLATRAAAGQSESGGAVPSEFEQWLEAERARGRINVAPDPLPEQDDSPSTALLRAHRGSRP